MNKYFRVIIALALVLGVAILATDNLAWAGPKTEMDSSDLAQDELSPPLAAPEPGSVKPPPDSVIIADTGGTFPIGGICTFFVEYNISGLKDVVFVEKSIEKSRSIPFPEDDGKIHLPGCHVLHYKLNQLMTEMSLDDGRWEICFAARPEVTTTIYYYLDDLEVITPPWVPLETTVEDGIACAPALFTGVYAPASK